MNKKIEVKGVNVTFIKTQQENLNSVFINEGMPQAERLRKLNQVAISQMKILVADDNVLKIEGKDE